MPLQNIKRGQTVSYKNSEFTVKALLSLSEVLLQSSSGEIITSPVSDILLCTEQTSLHEVRRIKVDTSLINEEQLNNAKLREAIIKPIALSSSRTVMDIENASKQLNISSRQVYNLIKRYINSHQQLLSFLPRQPSGGKGKSRIKLEHEVIIKSAIDKIYLTKQRNKISTVIEYVNELCKNSNLKRPSPNTIRRRIAEISGEKQTVLRRDGHVQAKNQFRDIYGKFPETIHPLDVIQMDHTPVDLIIVDEENRQPIGRPYLTISIDVFSRCITGFCLTLEAPSAVSVGLCLAHSVICKDAWLKNKGVDSSSPIWGKPKKYMLITALIFTAKL